MDCCSNAQNMARMEKPPKSRIEFPLNAIFLVGRSADPAKRPGSVKTDLSFMPRKVRNMAIDAPLKKKRAPLKSSVAKACRPPPLGHAHHRSTRVVCHRDIQFGYQMSHYRRFRKWICKFLTAANVQDFRADFLRRMFRIHFIILAYNCALVLKCIRKRGENLASLSFGCND